jgi:hypothetical protein
MEQALKSNGATKRGEHHRPEIVTQITLCRKDQLSACQDRLVRIFANGEYLYSDWHGFTKLRRQFQKKFGRPIPGVADAYEGQVRTKLDVEQLIDDATEE